MIIFLFFVSMERSDFLGLILVLRGLPFWGKKWTKNQNKFFSYGLLFSALMDIIWFFIYFLFQGCIYFQLYLRVPIILHWSQYILGLCHFFL